jgi:hypothetical protein
VALNVVFYFDINILNGEEGGGISQFQVGSGALYRVGHLIKLNLLLDLILVDSQI